jgi:hypothetical protein
MKSEKYAIISGLIQPVLECIFFKHSEANILKDHTEIANGGKYASSHPEDVSLKITTFTSCRKRVFSSASSAPHRVRDCV